MQKHLVRAGLAALVVLSIASPAAYAQSDQPAEKVILRVGTTVDLVTANPWAVNSGSDWAVVTAQYDMLLRFSDEDASPAPSLATGCEPNEDYTEWTCTLRDGLKWSDGEPLTSRDVAFSYRFVIDHKIPQYRGYFPFDPVFETPNDTTLIWTASQPTFAPAMPPWVYITPEHVWSQYVGADRKTIMAVPNVPSIASGPFTLTEWERGEFWTMERNPNFWGEQPVVDEIQYRIFTNQEALVQALKNGEVDFADGLKASLFGSIENEPTITTHQTIADWWLNLAFNFGGQGPDADPAPALHDLALRTAIEMAIDKQEIADKVYMGTAEPADTIIRPASAYWHLDIPADQEVPFDPVAANAMLGDAGYADTNGDGIREDPKTGEELNLRMPASSDTTGAVEAGRLIVSYLKDIGIKVRLQPASDSLMGEFWGAGNFDMYIWYWSGDPDPDYQLMVFTSDQCGDWSDGCWQDPHFDALYEEQRGIMDRDARLQVVQEAQQYLYEQVPAIPLAYPGSLQAYRNDRFEGWVPAPGPQGYLLPGYNYSTLLSLRPVAASAGAPASAGLPAWIWMAAAVAGVVLVGGVAIRSRRRPADEV